MIKQYSRDSAFFRSLRDRNMTIAHKDLDTSFNKLIQYLNKQILPVINILTDKKAVGVIGHADSFLRNVGDGTTIFDNIRSSDLASATLSLDRFKKQSAFSVIASDYTKQLKSINSSEAKQLLVSELNQPPKWKKIAVNNFQYHSITDQKVGIAALSARHLAAGIIGKPLSDDAIETSYIKDKTIPAQKINDLSISSGKITGSPSINVDL